MRTLGTTKQMVGLLSEFEARLPLSPTFAKLRDQERFDDALSMGWILKVKDIHLATIMGILLNLCTYSTPCLTQIGVLLARKGNYYTPISSQHCSLTTRFRYIVSANLAV